MARSLNEVVSYANELVGLHDFKDYGPMGLQYRSHSNGVGTIAYGVSINEDLINLAIDEAADLILVHHGLFWNNEPREVDQRMAKRIALLETNNISVLAYHLALDAHPKFGNNVLALEPFQGELRRFADIGWGKKLNRPFKRVNLEQWPGIKYLYGPTQIRKVAAIVGGAPHYIHDAVREGYDLFITGEAAEPTQSLAKELGINFVALGHYNSEKSGVITLADLIAQEFGLRKVFLDIPNSV